MTSSLCHSRRRRRSCAAACRRCRPARSWAIRRCRRCRPRGSRPSYCAAPPAALAEREDAGRGDLPLAALADLVLDVVHPRADVVGLQVEVDAGVLPAPVVVRPAPRVAVSTVCRFSHARTSAPDDRSLPDTASRSPSPSRSTSSTALTAASMSATRYVAKPAHGAGAAPAWASTSGRPVAAGEQVDDAVPVEVAGGDGRRRDIGVGDLGPAVGRGIDRDHLQGGRQVADRGREVGVAVAVEVGRRDVRDHPGAAVPTHCIVHDAHAEWAAGVELDRRRCPRRARRHSRATVSALKSATATAPNDGAANWPSGAHGQSHGEPSLGHSATTPVPAVGAGRRHQVDPAIAVEVGQGDLGVARARRWSPPRSGASPRPPSKGEPSFSHPRICATALSPPPWTRSMSPSLSRSAAPRLWALSA